jgi:cobalt-zinc-cadmium efflux system outer membrane protein
MEYSYQRGEVSLIELLDAQRAYFDTLTGYNDARAEVVRATSELRAAVGEIR